jgi:hypothetical protein
VLNGVKRRRKLTGIMPLERWVADWLIGLKLLRCILKVFFMDQVHPRLNYLDTDV